MIIDGWCEVLRSVCFCRGGIGDRDLMNEIMSFWNDVGEVEVGFGVFSCMLFRRKEILVLLLVLLEY